jgi:hypothetical protein
MKPIPLQGLTSPETYLIFGPNMIETTPSAITAKLPACKNQSESDQEPESDGEERENQNEPHPAEEVK